MVDAVVYLVPLGRDRYELYSEPPDEAEPGPPRDGFFRRRIDAVAAWWRTAVHSARARGDGSPHEGDQGIFARGRHWLVSQIAETIAEQRTLWSLRQLTRVELRYPADLKEPDAATLRQQILMRAGRHHGSWLIVDGLLFATSAPLLMLVPGPNVIAYYFGLRAGAHFLSWRGARRGLDALVWNPCAEPALTELANLADQPRDTRAPRVEAIAAALKLPRLAAFFDRVAV